MSYEWRKESGFLRVFGMQSVTAETIREICDSVPDLARRSGLSKVLLDGREITGRALGTMARYEFAVIIAEHFRGFTVAVVLGPDHYDPGKFGETVANNRGVDLRVFLSLEEAYTWLEARPEPMLGADRAG